MYLEKNHSTDLILIDITDKILQAISNTLYSAGIFINLSKAFDTVDHLIMLSKLEHYRICVLLLSGSKIISARGNSLSLLMVNILIASHLWSPSWVHSRSPIVFYVF